jgi:hypothetical protein
MRQGGVAHDRAQCEADQGEHDQDRDRELPLGQGHEGAGAETDESTGRRPHDLLGPEALDVRRPTGPQLSPRDGRGSAEDPLDDSAEALEVGRQQLPETKQRRGRRPGAEQARWHRRVPQVGRQP